MRRALIASNSGVAYNTPNSQSLRAPNATLHATLNRFGGSRTECALLMMLRAWGTDYQQLREALGGRVLQSVGFSSERKMSSVLLAASSEEEQGGGEEGRSHRLYSKVHSKRLGFRNFRCRTAQGG